MRILEKRAFCILFAALLGFAVTGCDAVWYIRMDVREGAEPGANVIPVAMLSDVEGKPIPGATVELTRRNAHGEVLYTLHLVSDSDGKVFVCDVGPFGPRDVRDFRCSKAGYGTVTGRCELTRVRGPYKPPEDTLLIIMVPTGEDQRPDEKPK